MAYPGIYGDPAYSKRFYTAANQAATAFSVALNTTYTGIVVSNPAGSPVNLSIHQVSLALTVAPAAIASIGVFGGFLAAGITAHTTPLTPFSNFLGYTQAPKALADAAATLVGTPVWIQQLMSGFTAAALPSSPLVMADFGGSIIVPPGAYFGIGALTAVTGFGAITWAETPQQ